MSSGRSTITARNTNRRANPEHAGVADLIPAEVVFGARVHAAYEQVLLARALGIVNDGELGDTHLAAAQLLAAPESAAYRERLETRSFRGWR